MGRDDDRLLGIRWFRWAGLAGCCHRPCSIADKAQAREVLGEHDASIVVAAILQRSEEIKSAGGYLRVLTAKGRAGEFSIGPVLVALLRGKAAKAARERKRAG